MVQMTISSSEGKTEGGASIQIFTERFGMAPVFEKLEERTLTDQMGISVGLSLGKRNEWVCLYKMSLIAQLVSGFRNQGTVHQSSLILKLSIIAPAGLGLICAGKIP